MKKKHNNELTNPTNDVSIDDYLAAKAELDALRKEHGLEAEEKGLKRMITQFFEHSETREKVLVNKKKLIWMTLLLGWTGAHRFYTKRYRLGWTYLLLCWTCIPLGMSIIDILEYIPVPSDENGNILV